MSTASTMRRKLRLRRESRQFNEAVRTASPAMQQELLAMAARHIGR
ncbi:MAG: hypothetical protein QOG98_2626 [Pseudonocardiales bacterium]|jgi:hypothetical protein|nr:hypothetical protein [Pseudonocardiales bacterium]MDT4976868.1 hypothetical protein [Pseudonocardiales bacterium]